MNLSLPITLYKANNFLHYPMIFFLWLSISLFLNLTAIAQPTLVKDINAGQKLLSLHPKELITVNGILYFSGYDPVNGRELWRSDGTKEGTYILKDVTPGSSDSNPEKFININGTIYFVANSREEKPAAFDWERKFELWKTDGTVNGTVKIKDMDGGRGTAEFGGPPPPKLAAAGNTLFFTAGGDYDYYYLWKSDGTSSGTVALRAFSDEYSEDRRFTEINGTLYFTAEGDLWKSNGTPAGTVFVRESVTHLISINSTLYFSSYTETTGSELWKSNGTTAGTILVKDIYDGSTEYGNGYFIPNSSQPESLTDVNGILYFTASDGLNGRELWKSDGTAAGTTLVKDIYSGTRTNEYGELIFNSSSPEFLTNVNGTLYFTALSTTNELGLWKSNGTAAGTVLVKGNFERKDQFYYPTFFINVNGSLYFTAYTSINGNELWKSNGTEAGTTIVKDILPGSNSSNPSNLTSVNGVLFFTADDGNNGREFWKNNGTTAEIISTETNQVIGAGSNPSSFTDLNGVIYFLTDSQLWKSNGTLAGTMLIKNVGAAPSSLTEVNGTLFFSTRTVSSNSTFGRYLWKSDGTETGTTMIKDLSSNTIQDPKELTIVNGVLYFVLRKSENKYELWKSDGTAIGTVPIKEFEGSMYGGSKAITELINLKGVLYFITSIDGTSRQLWKSDGTTAGTLLVKDIGQTFWSFQQDKLTKIGETLFFVGDDGINGAELWKSDGTTAGTLLVKDIFPGSGSSEPKSLIDVKGILHFITADATGGNKIYKSNGTAAGTVAVKEIPAEASNLTYTDGRFFFFTTKYSYWHDYENKASSDLWVVEETAEKALKLKDGFKFWEIDEYTEFYENSWESEIDGEVPSMINLNNTVYFYGDDGVNGYELWRSDGTATGTALVADLNLGVLSSVSKKGYPFNSNGKLFFSANDGKTGSELWKFEPSNCTTLQTNLTVLGSTVCEGQNGQITIPSSQLGISYQVYINEAAIGSAVKGGGNITLTVPAANLALGDNIFTLKASSCFVAPLTNTAKIILQATCPQTCTASGTILREYWANVTGTAVSAIPVNTTPTSTSQLTSFETLSNLGDNYGQRVRGYICAPATGNYIFYIAGDDNSELWLSTDDQPSTKQRIAHISGTGSWATSKQWTKFSTQKSATIVLQAGKKYYIEALQKEGVGGDHLAVGWTLPNTSGISVINGTYLSPFVSAPINQLPTALIKSPINNASFVAPASITIEATATDTDGSVAKVEFYNGVAKLGEDLTAPYSYTWSNIVAGTYSLIAKAIDNSSGITTSAVINITVNSSSSACNVTGSILREYWANVTGTTISSIPLNTTPTSTSQLTSFEAPTNAGDSYGARIRGYICAPATGYYTFYIAGDDNSELWLSTDETPVNKKRIAHISGMGSWTMPKEWTKFASQKSVAISLQAGRRYYIEALQKEGVGGDNLAVGWALPNTSAIAVIPGAQLSPFVPAPTNCTATGTILREYWANITGTSILSIPLGTTPTSISQLTTFEGPTNVADNYGVRVRGYICAPTTGNYIFYLAGDDNSELYLSTDDNAANKRLIASIIGWTTSREWTKFASQKSATISLSAGKRYYIEALQKEGIGGDNLAVGWIMPNTSAIAVIAGSYLSPFVPNTAKLASEDVLTEKSNLALQVFPNPSSGERIQVEAQGFESEEEISLNVYNSVGKIVFSQVSKADDGGMITEELYFINTLSSGIYTLMLQSRNSSLYKNILISK